MKPSFGKSWAWEFTNAVSFDLWPLVQGQITITTIKIAYNSIIIEPRGLGCETDL